MSELSVKVPSVDLLAALSASVMPYPLTWWVYLMLGIAEVASIGIDVHFGTGSETGQRIFGSMYLQSTNLAGSFILLNRAVCVAVETGLLASLMTSTFPKPTMAAVIPETVP